MIIYTNEGNPLGLKLLICAELAKKEVLVKTVDINDAQINEPKHLPILQLNSGVQLFSSNSAAQYLLPEDDETELRDKWLEFSSARLAPALTHFMAAGPRADPNALSILNSFIKKMDDTLKDSAYLTGAKLTAADISCWSLLAPDGTLKGAQNVDNLRRWYRSIAELPEVKNALKVMPIERLHFASILQSNKFGGLHHIELVPHVGDEELHLLADIVANVADTILPDEIKLAQERFVYEKSGIRGDSRLILPKPNERNVLITSALPYVNNVPHLGNIIGCVLSADIFARYSRQCGYNTMFICGTDEYGTATETKALAENVTPQQICDKYFDIHNTIYRWFGIGFDYFGRTTTHEQTEIVQQMFLELKARGFIEMQFVEQLLCQKCDRFLADRFVEGTCPHPGCGYEDARGDQCDGCGKLVNANDLIRPRCKTCSAAPVVRQSKQFFLDLPKIEPKLKEWVESVEMGWTSNARVITRAWLKEGLKSRCITRDLKWGIPVPVEGFESKVFYVWFDAPIGYMSITAKYTKEWRKWWQPKEPNTVVELFQFMAKDNVPFHSVMFPASLLAIDTGYTLVSHIMATEYLNYEDGKFSKSRGIGVFGNDAQDTGIPADVWRFYLASARPEGQDSCFSWNDLGTRNNSELLNNFGNFANRALVFCEKNYGAIIPDIVLGEDELILLALINREIKGYVQSMEKTKFRDGIRHTLTISRHGNQYMQAQQPWVLLKGTDVEKQRAATVIGISCNITCLLAALIYPFMPTTARTMFAQLNVTDITINAAKPQMQLYLPTGHRIGKPVPLFAKIEQSRIDELKLKYAGVQQGVSIANSNTNIEIKSRDDADKAVALQAEKVRLLKASGVEKAVWQPEVKILLDLKKKLAAFESAPVSSATTVASSAAANLNQVNELEQRIEQQGLKVRQLKSSADRSVWQPEVDILLGLKKQLTALSGGATTTEVSSGKNKKKK